MNNICSKSLRSELREVTTSQKYIVYSILPGIKKSPICPSDKKLETKRDNSLTHDEDNDAMITYRHRRMSSLTTTVISSMSRYISRKVCKKVIHFHDVPLRSQQNQIMIATSRLLSKATQNKTSTEKKEAASINTGGKNSDISDRDQVQNRFDFRKTRSSNSVTQSNVAPFGSYSALYSFKGIILTRRILRLQYLITPYSWYMVWQNSSEPFVIAFSTLTTTVSVLFLSFMPRMVMKFSVGKTGDTIDTAKVATMDVFGRRKDTYYKISDIVPLMELPAITTKDWYIPFLVYGEKRRRFLFLLGAQWEDHATFRKIMGDFPHGKK